MYLNNISEFARFNDISIFDNKENPKEYQPDETFIRGLLMNLELLAHEWKIINKEKYKHRFSEINQKDN